MSDSIEQKQQQVESEHMKTVRRRGMLTGLGAVIVVIVALALMMPAISATWASMPINGGQLAAGKADFSSRPAQSFEQVVVDSDGYEVATVSVEAPEGALPVNTTMKATLVEDKDVLDAAREAAADDADIAVRKSRAVAVDIVFIDSQGIEVEPAIDVSVALATPEVAIRSQLAVVHVDDDNVASVVESEKVATEDDQVTFSASEFSVYAIVYTVSSPSALDGKSFGIVNNKDTVSGTALMTDAKDNDTKLAGKKMTVRTEPIQREGIVFVANNSDISMWTFHKTDDNPENKQFHIAIEVNGVVKYLRIADEGVSLVDQTALDESCVITVEAGTGKNQGKYKFSTATKELRLNGSNFEAAAKSTNNANSWMNLAELSNLNDDDFVTYTATKVSVSDTVNVPDGAQVVVYTRIWNSETLRYEYYAIDYDGKLVRAYESGDTISWVGTKINTMLWDFTEYHYDDGTPNNYYEFQNVYSGKYIAPQVSNTSFLSNNPIGVNLNGRRNNEYYTSILAWDDPYYDYASLHAKNGQLISVPMSKADDFYFAIMTPVDHEEDLNTVATIDHKPFGITLKMQNYGNGTGDMGITSYNRAKQQVDVLGNTAYNQWTGSPGLLKRNLTEAADGDYRDSYPMVAEKSHTTHSLGELYNDTLEVNQQFLLTTYEETGYFEYDSTQNFAHLITSEDDKWFGEANKNGGTYGVGDFVIYEQLGTSDEGNKDTLKHGQFLPYNDLDPTKISKKYVNEMDIHAQPLSSLDPRKGEQLYNIPYKQGKTASDGYVDHFFGMEMSASFMQSENGLDDWGHDLIFEFSGDDDFWLYVDGMLVLDLGGIHSALDGSINFRTGQVIVNGTPTTLREQYRLAYLENHAGASDDEVNEWLNGIFKDDGSNTGTVFKDYSGHTMRMFYMERGAGASNLHMRFNLAPYTDGEVQLEKEVSGTDNVQYTDAVFPFQIWWKDPAHPAGEYVLWDDASKVTDMQTKEEAAYQESYEVGGKTYQHVFFLRPDQTVSVKLPSEETEYYFKECGIDSNTYDAVYINRSEDPLPSTADTASSDYKDFQIVDSTVAGRKKVIFDNHVGQNALKNMMIVKKVWADEGKTIPWPDDDTPFKFRIYIGKSGSDYSIYSFGEYRVKNPDGEYCVYQDGQFVSTGETEFGNLRAEALPGEMKSQQEQATFYTSQGGMADKIPPYYVIEIQGLMEGTPFMVEERGDEIPAGYKLIDYELAFGDVAADPANVNYGVVSTSKPDPIVTINNRHGYGLTVNKVWSDVAFMESHDPIYFAVYLKGAGSEGSATESLTLVDGSVRKMVSPSVSYTWFFEELAAGKTLNDYVVYEVKLAGNEDDFVVDPVTGAVSGYSGIERVEQDGTIEVHGVSNDHGYSQTFTYTASYDREELTQEQIDAQVNARTDTVTNSRPGLKLVKTNMATPAVPLEGGMFTLAESDGGAAKKTFTSDENGLIAVAYLQPDTEYVLTETASPHGHQPLIESVTIKVTTENGKYRVYVNGSDADPTGDNPMSGYYTIYQVNEPTVENMPIITIKNKPFAFKAVKIATDTNGPVEGAKFALYSQQYDYYTHEPIPDYSPMEGFENLVTSADGIIPQIDLDNLQAGTYYLREEEAPSGYRPVDGFVRFEISEKGQVTKLSGPDEASVKTVEGEDGSETIVLSIKNSPMKTVQILKKSSDGDKPELEGVEFALYKMGQIENNRPKDGEVPVLEGATDEHGVLNLGVLQEGIAYYLFETKALDGYNMLSAPVIITSTSSGLSATLGGAPLDVKQLSGTGDKEVWQVTVINYAGYELPNTGGIGTTILYVIGGIMVVLAVVFLVRRKR